MTAQRQQTPPREMTTAEAATELGLALRTVQDRIERGDVLARRIGARLWLLDADAVERLRALGRKPMGRPPLPTAPKPQTP